MRWPVVARALVSGSLAFTALSGCCRLGVATRPFTPAELEVERASLQDDAGPSFQSAVVAPFVILAQSDTRDRATLDDAAQTVTWARDRLRASFFDHEPGKIVSIWVFPDEESYMRGASATLGTIPTTPYGFYRPCKRQLVVNAGLGWGTMVHELVHAFMAADFPDAPAWMQEGLASLFEAPRDAAPSGDAGAALPSIRGEVNWRLPALQEAIARGGRAAPSFEEMFGGGRGDFDGKRGALLYATSRYLLYYLQERGQLVRFYRAFRDAVACGRDPRGQETLAQVTTEIARGDLVALRHDFEGYVASLRFSR